MPEDFVFSSYMQWFFMESLAIPNLHTNTVYVISVMSASRRDGFQNHDKVYSWLRRRQSQG